ncbi:galactose oxidase-like domain-containing protein [Streptomyces sp. NPDC001435]|uniref:galactose oxidase-like domain-containing protein n=1 Tax=unclassified Streptomyces TaxID=2593676 RepID=UPI00367FA79D
MAVGAPSSRETTDVEQRSIALGLKGAKDGKGISGHRPNNRNLVPAGWYMLFVTDDQGTPSRRYGSRCSEEVEITVRSAGACAYGCGSGGGR